MMTDERTSIDAFLAGDRFAVVGASTDRSKYGNKVLRAYLQTDRTVHPVNPKASEVEGLPAFTDLASLVAEAGPLHGVSIITPPAVTEQVVADALAAGVRHLWMQPGAESAAAIEAAQAAGANVIAGGPCALVVLGYTESP
ncbi:MAG: CoA-binding protein [Planctomycetota bacterium]|jgi:predicted CoA-binding protein